MSEDGGGDDIDLTDAYGDAFDEWIRDGHSAAWEAVAGDGLECRSTTQGVIASLSRLRPQ